ncbi:alpha/beta hydrolase [Mycobacterium sp. ITM-2016-00317]|uniref:alpha/beta hydrolase n=1 Tax=Mycobacterium sp. ITM-2016-00317 TaxID=2099694 RepID=UPI000D433DDB|nr:alpha/beta hydrolase [Mycobacterium sp. ITM-2016-00317]WNG90219.1 alpha/beta hydrolase [Mycobacterium sp. ITM-2016-00317]
MRFPDIEGDRSDDVVVTRHGPTPVTIYRPRADTTDRPGVYVNVHGGGFVVGHPEQDDPWCRYLAARAGVVVVNVDYAVAPAARFPTAVEQLVDVVRWAASPDRDWDGARLCVGGQSAGGNLSAAVSRVALEEGGPAIALQVLHYAPLDLVTPTAAKFSPLGNRAILKPWMGEVFDTAYIPDPAHRKHRLASPAWGTNADDIAGIAPALVITAEYDRLRDEGARYAAKLDAAGALVRHDDVAGVDHGYNIMSDNTDVTRRMYDLIVAEVRTSIAHS